MTCQTLCALVHYYKRHRSRTQLKAAWRKKKGGGGGGGPGATKLDKLVRSVRGRLAEPFSGERLDPLLTAVVDYIESHWSGPKS